MRRVTGACVRDVQDRDPGQTPNDLQKAMVHISSEKLFLKGRCENYVGGCRPFFWVTRYYKAV